MFCGNLKLLLGNLALTSTAIFSLSFDFAPPAPAPRISFFGSGFRENRLWNQNLENHMSCGNFKPLVHNLALTSSTTFLSLSTSAPALIRSPLGLKGKIRCESQDWVNHVFCGNLKPLVHNLWDTWYPREPKPAKGDTKHKEGSIIG